MRVLDVALATLALRASATRPPEHERRLVPAIDDADAATLDRAAISHERAAMIASLWPPARQCVVPAVYAVLPAPAVLSGLVRLTWRAPSADARVLQKRLQAAVEQGALSAAA
jgi:hypothetical protein